jgi:hypothetical protein
MVMAMETATTSGETMERTSFGSVPVVLAMLICGIVAILGAVPSAGQHLGPSHSVQIHAEDKGPTGTGVYPPVQG